MGRAKGKIDEKKLRSWKLLDEVCNRRVGLGSFLEAQGVFDPELLKEVFLDLAAENRTSWGDARLAPLADKVSVERHCYLSSLSLDIELFARAARGHWSVENSCHWVLDVVMREDDSRTRSGHVAENLATLRRMTINLRNREKTKKRGIKGKQLNASWNHAYLLRLLDF